MALIAASVPAEMALAGRIAAVRKTASKASDTRVKGLTDLLRGIRYVKVCVCVCVCACVCVYVCMCYVCCVCMYAYAYTHAHICVCLCSTPCPALLTTTR
jgi:hypothetical protein